MNNIAIARRFRGMNANTLADEIGVSCQHVSSWERGVRNPNRSTGQRLAEILDVDVAWIMDCPQTAQLFDPSTGEPVLCKIMRCEEIEGYGLMYHLYIPETGDIATVLRCRDGVEFTTRDWMGKQPQNASEIAEYDWMDWRRVNAIMFDGLPRILA